ncbi:MAG: AMP-binding protein, partial [Alphaproteobacteria bacterium]|nr:AMP-binding protein [Alphaproteobacteria bacterium]
MRDHAVTISESEAGPELGFAAVFNATVAFIDRHLDESRSDKPAIRSDAGEVTYGQLARRVNRAANALCGLGIAPGERLLMAVKDRPEFFYLFWGAVKAGVVPVAVNTLLRAEDYQYLIADSGAAAVVYSPDLAEAIEGAVAAMEAP